MSHQPGLYTDSATGATEDDPASLALSQTPNSPLPDDGTETPGLAGPLLRLVLAMAVAALALRLLTSGGIRNAPSARFSPTPPAVVEHPLATASRPVAGAAAPAPAPAPTPPRTDFASIPEAGMRLGFTVWYPTVLPDQYVTLAVAWQPDSFAVAPGQRPRGTLRAWFWSPTDGAGLLLEQGPGIGVTVSGAPPGTHGTVTLPDGRQLVWTRGHPGLPEDPTAHTPVWTGDELRLGIPPASTEPGWRLISGVLPLAELLRVAGGLR